MLYSFYQMLYSLYKGIRSGNALLLVVVVIKMCLLYIAIINSNHKSKHVANFIKFLPIIIFHIFTLQRYTAR